MDDITTRTIVIAVNIFVTIIIISLLVTMFFQMKNIYGAVAKTDTSIYNKFNEVYSMYHGKVETGMGLLNTLKKYEENTEIKITITYDGYEEIREKCKNEAKREVDELRKLMEKGTNYKFEDKYNVTVTNSEDGTVIVDFDRTVEAKK